MLFTIKGFTHLAGKNWRFGFFKVMTITATCFHVETLVAKNSIDKGRKWADDNCHFILSLIFVTWREKAVGRCLGLCL
jgi:hypothetical protein